MGQTQRSGLRYPDDPDLYADIIKFFTELAEDCDTKLMSLQGGEAAGEVGATYLFATSGGTTTQSYFLRSTRDGSGFNFYDDGQRLDGGAGRRLWVDGPAGGDVAIAPKDGNQFGQVLVRGVNIRLEGNVTVTGGLDVQGTSTKRHSMETNHSMSATGQGNWTAFNPGVHPNWEGTTFVAPPSGSVQIGFGGMLPARNKQVALSYAVRRGPGIGAGDVVLATTPWPGIQQPPPHAIATNGMNDEVGQWVSVFTAYFLANLVPGETYNVKPYYVNENAAALACYRAYFIITPDL